MIHSLVLLLWFDQDILNFRKGFETIKGIIYLEIAFIKGLGKCLLDQGIVNANKDLILFARLFFLLYFLIELIKILTTQSANLTFLYRLVQKHLFTLIFTGAKKLWATLDRLSISQNAFKHLERLFKTNLILIFIHHWFEFVKTWV